MLVVCGEARVRSRKRKKFFSEILNENDNKMNFKELG
jgi:hypothetical protein